MGDELQLAPEIHQKQWALIISSEKNWVKEQWASKRKNALSHEREDKLLAAGFDFIPNKLSLFLHCNYNLLVLQ